MYSILRNDLWEKPEREKKREKKTNSILFGMLFTFYPFWVNKPIDRLQFNRLYFITFASPYNIQKHYEQHNNPNKLLEWNKVCLIRKTCVDISILNLLKDVRMWLPVFLWSKKYHCLLPSMKVQFVRFKIFIIFYWIITVNNINLSLFSRSNTFAFFGLIRHLIFPRHS